MSANTPGGYLGQGGKRVSRKPDFNPLPGVPALYDAMRQEDLRRALQPLPPPVLPITEAAAATDPGVYPIPSMGTQPDGRVIREIQQRGVGGEPVGPVVGTSKTVQYTPEQSLMPSAVAPTSKTVQYPTSAPPTSLWDRPEDRRLRRLREEWERRRGDAAWTTPQQAPAPQQSGTIVPATMDPAQQPTVRNADGSVSTVRSITVEFDGQHTVLPTVSPDGRILSDEEAVAEFRKTGRHLGVYGSQQEADAAAQGISASESQRVAGQQVAASPRPAEFAPPQKWWLHSDRAIEAARKKRDEWSPIEAAIDDFHDRGHDIAAANWRGQVDLWRAVTNTPEIRYNATPEQMTPSPEARRILDMGFKEYAKTLSHEDRFAFNRFTYGKREEDFERRYGPRLNDWVKFHAWRQSQRVPEQQAPAPGVGNVPQPPAAGQSAPGTLTPEQMQQMGSPSPDARRYDGLNYKSNNVVSASRAVGDVRGRMGGSAVGRKQSEAISQMTRIANGMAEGRGGQQYRDAVAAFEAAIASGDQTAINAAESNLSTLLSPMLDKFDARFKGEVGDIGIDIRKQFMDTLRGRIQAGTAGTMRGMPQSAAMPPQTGGMPGAPQVRGPQAPSRPTPPQAPRVGPGGIRSYQFGSMAEAYEGINTGQMQSGDLVTIAGSNYTAVPTFDANGNPEWGLAPAFAFGGVGDTPAMAVPDPFSFPDADAWGSSLSDLQRQTMLDALMTDSSLRSGLERGTLDQIDRVRRSRQGLMRNSMSAKDRETAMRTLRLEENAALYAAMGSVGARGQGRAMSMSQYMEGERQAELDRELEKQAAKTQIELAAAEQNRVRNAEIKEEHDRVAAERARQKSLDDATIKAAEQEATDRRKQYNETVQRRREMVPHTREAVRGFIDGGKDVKTPIDDPAVKRLWESLSPEQRDQYERWSSLLAETAPEFDEPLRDNMGEYVYEKDETNSNITDENGNKIHVKRQVPLNPNAFLPRADLIKVLQSLSKYEPPPQMEPELTDVTTSADQDAELSWATTETVKDKTAVARNKMLLDWWQGRNGKMVGEIIASVAKHAPGLEREMLADMGINRAAATSIISEWQSNVFDVAVASKDMGRIREALLDLHGLATVANATGASYELSGLQQPLGTDPEAFADAVIAKMRGDG